MPFIVRWRTGGSEASIRCERVGASPILSNRLQLLGVTGLGDPDHPKLQLHTLTVIPDDIVWIAEGVELPVNASVEEAGEEQDGGNPGGDSDLRGVDSVSKPRGRSGNTSGKGRNKEEDRTSPSRVDGDQRLRPKTRRRKSTRQTSAGGDPPAC